METKIYKVLDKGCAYYVACYDEVDAIDRIRKFLRKPVPMQINQIRLATPTEIERVRTSIFKVPVLQELDGGD